MDAENDMLTLAWAENFDKRVVGKVSPTKFDCVQTEVPITGTRLVKKIIIKTISRCYHSCPYFELDGGPGPVMTCGYKDAPESGYIISHPACDEGFPAKCPLWRE